MLKTYKKIKYTEKSSGKWQIIWPSGLKVVIEADDEEALKLKIDHALQLLK